MILGCLLLSVGRASAESDEVYDAFLSRIIQSYDLKPLPTKPFEETAKYILGQALFFDPILSGNRDVACGTCHLLERGASDGLATSLGTGAIGLAEQRALDDGLPQQPRNALDLWNRDNNAALAMFWDGRVEALDPGARSFRSPLGERLPSGLQNTMAVQALFPLAQDDEMLGRPGDHSAQSLPPPHSGKMNEIASGAAHLNGPARIEKILHLVVTRILGNAQQPLENWQIHYRQLFRQAYPDVSVSDYSIVEIANALAHFEEVAFATRETPWDRYLSGDKTAISLAAKKGAFLFYGKGRCAVCHSGPLLSDFSYHAIGVRPFGPGYDGAGEDLGRYRVTKAPEDKYKFRTPPLRNVTKTAPYFHNGSAQTLEDAIVQHIEPLRYADKYLDSGAHMMSLAEIQAISPILTLKTSFDAEDIAPIIEFMRSLENAVPDIPRNIIPTAVPSGLPVQSLLPSQ